jgi:hypothetical protein
MLITFFDIKGIFFILNSFNKAKQSTKLMMCKYCSGYVKLCVQKAQQFDSAQWRAHKALSVKQFLAQKSITQMEQPTYSSDVVPSDFRLFRKNKVCLKRIKIQYTEDTKKKKWRWHWKIFHNISSETFPIVAASLG